MSATVETPAPAMAVDAEPRALLSAELEVLLAALVEPAARAPFLALAAAVAEGAVGEAELPALDRLLALTLETGRARRVHGPEAERALLRLFHQTPRGAAARRAVEAVNAALAGLRGQTLEDLLVTVQGPGLFRLGVSTGECRLTLELDAQGLRVESLEV